MTKVQVIVVVPKKRGGQNCQWRKTILKPCRATAIQLLQCLLPRRCKHRSSSPVQECVPCLASWPQVLFVQTETETVNNKTREDQFHIKISCHVHKQETLSTQFNLLEDRQWIVHASNLPAGGLAHDSPKNGNHLVLHGSDVLSTQHCDQRREALQSLSNPRKTERQNTELKRKDGQQHLTKKRERRRQMSIRNTC